MQSKSAESTPATGAVGATAMRRVPSERPVFVDVSGRRQRLVRLAGRVVVVPAIGYLGLIFSSLLGGPSVNLPFLPLPTAPHASGHESSVGAGAHSGGGTAGASGSGLAAVTGTGTTAGAAGATGGGATGGGAATAGVGTRPGGGATTAPAAPGAGTTGGTTPGAGASAGTGAPGAPSSPSATPSAAPTTTAPPGTTNHGHSTHTPGQAPSHRPTKKATKGAR